MTVEVARRWLLLANVPAVIFTCLATFTALFGLAAPEPNPIRWVFGFSPILLALWLASANWVHEGHVVIAMAMLLAPIRGLTSFVALALTS